MSEINKILLEINKGISYPFYLLMGNEPYFIDIIVESLKKKNISNQSKDFDFTLIYGKDTSIDNIIEVSKRFPLISEKQLIVVKEAQYLDKNINELINYIKYPQPRSILVFCYNNKKLDKRKQIYKHINKIGLIFESKPLYQTEVLEWTRKRANELDIKLTIEAIKVINSFIGNNLRMIDLQLEKLKVSTEDGDEITPEVIEKHTGYSKDFNVFELQKSLVNKNLSQSYRIIKYMSSNKKKYPIVLVINLLFNFFKKVLVYKGITNKLKAPIILRISPFFIKEYEYASKIFSNEQLINVIEFIMFSDLKSKGINTKESNPEEILKELIYKIINT